MANQTIIKSRGVIDKIMDNYHLTEVWRCRNEQEIRFSWSRRVNDNLTLYSRIDFALTSIGVDQMVEMVTYLQGICTDHSAIYLSINLSQNERGPGYWKLNGSLLQTDSILIKIQEGVQLDVNASQNKSATERWSHLKVQIKKIMQRLQRDSATESQLVISQLSKEVAELEEAMPLAKNQMELYLNTKHDLEELQLERARQLIFRSKARWYGEVSRIRNIFITWKKMRYNMKTCSSILTEEGVLLTKDDEILNKEKAFYQHLYEKDRYVNFDLVNQTDICISEEERNRCDQEFTIGELRTAVMNLKANKTPGIDGIVAEFYQQMFDIIGEPLLDMIHNSYQNNYLDEEICMGVLNLILKAGKDSRMLKNLRPITLLNTDYKIIEKMIANRIDPHLHSIIHSDQTGFMKNRRISTNIRKILDLMDYCDNNQIEAFIFGPGLQ